MLHVALQSPLQVLIYFHFLLFDPSHRDEDLAQVAYRDLFGTEFAVDRRIEFCEALKLDLRVPRVGAGATFTDCHRVQWEHAGVGVEDVLPSV